MPRDAVIGFVVFVFSAFYWLEADDIPISPLDGGVGADGLPKALALTLGTLSLLLVIRSLTARFSGVVESADQEPARTRWRPHLRAIGMLVIGVGYLFIVPYLGYVLSVLLLMLSTAVYNGKKPSVGLLAIAVSGAVFYYLLFVIFLGIPMPPGFWPGLLT
ncbi:MAG: tripartite tricarboxylate transporter TctB family protein [Rhodospirillales bacterium]|nr:tripartite tricarboxylate transporter TctB family protein [Rhodospirillales bacterium]